MTTTVHRAARSETETRPMLGASLPDIEPRDLILPGIDGYDLKKPLGHGGMGIVYLAWERALDRKVALKILPPRLKDDVQAVERFKREAKALAQIEHANIVPIYSTGEQDGLLYFTMAYLEGEPLNEVILAAGGQGESRFAPFFSRPCGDDHRSDLASAIVARSIVGALDDLHQVGIVHRDIKPGNIIFDAKGRPVLVDFGVACDPHSTRLNIDASSPGTLRFMPPEQLVAGTASDVDVRSDLYSLGLTLFEMLTLMPAFPQQEMGSLIDAIRNGDLARVRDIDPGIPRTLDAIVQRATALRPEDRFQTAREMKDALDQAMDQLADCSHLSGVLLSEQLERALTPEASRRTGLFRSGVTSRRGPAAAHRRMLPTGTALVLVALLLGAAWSPPGEGTPGQARIAGASFGGTPTTRGPAARIGQDGATGEHRFASVTGPNAPARQDSPGAAAVERLRAFVSSSQASPLLEAARLFLDGEQERARQALLGVDEPDEPLARLAFWQLVIELGDAQERRQARSALTGQLTASSDGSAESRIRRTATAPDSH